MIIYMKTKIVFFLIIILFLLFPLSTVVYAKGIFKVSLNCKGQDQEYCDIVKYSDNKISFILKNIREPQIEKMNENIFHAYGSCGSSCQYHFFVSESKQDQTKEYITFNKSNNCLIESDSKSNSIYARKLFSKNKILIINLKNKEFDNVPIDIFIYNSFQDKSYFDNKGKLHLMAMLADVDKNGNNLYFSKIIDKTCR